MVKVTSETPLEKLFFLCQRVSIADSFSVRVGVHAHFPLSVLGPEGVSFMCTLRIQSASVCLLQHPHHSDFPCHHAVLPQFLLVQLLFVFQDQHEEDELVGLINSSSLDLPALEHLQHWLLVLLLLYVSPVPSLFHTSKIVYIFQAFYFKVMAGGKHFIDT